MTSQQQGMNLKLVEYRNSGDIPNGDRSGVVGYNAIAAFIGKTSGYSTKEFNLSDADKTDLLSLARETITQFLKTNRNPSSEIPDLSDAVKTPCGAFVTLKKDGELRGCIGNFSSVQPLYKVVQDMALASAFQDTRFYPVSPGEMEKIEVEISVLTPLKPIKSIDEFVLGKHGIYMTSGSKSGTFLPQVAEETKWTKEEFLGHCARDKAGIGWDGWKSAQLYTYEAIVFSEGQFRKNNKK
jgi:AmmeMemoRadiSam system protein A